MESVVKRIVYRRIEAIDATEHSVSGRSSETSSCSILKLLRGTSVMKLRGSFAVGCICIVVSSMGLYF